MDKFKAIGWSILSCVIPLCLNLQAEEYGYYGMPNVVRPICCESDNGCLSPPCTGWDAPFRSSLSHTEGKWFDVDIGYTSFDGFVALGLGYQDAIIPFLDIRGHVFNDGKWAANVGGGLRYAIDSKSIVGFNLFYDYRETRWHHNFNQIGFGLEYLTRCFDIRLNAYFPVGTTKEKGTLHVFDQFVGPFFATCQQFRHALSGVDLEVGAWIIPRGSCRSLDFYGAIAPYYYSSRGHNRSHNSDHNCHRNSHRNSDNDVYGVAARFLTVIGDYLSLEVRAGYDRAYKGMLQGTLAFEIPLDKFFDWESWFKAEPCQTVNCRLYQPVVRQEIIVLDRKRCCWHSNF